MAKNFHQSSALSRLNFFAKRVKAFCAFCRVPRQVYKKKRIGAADVFAAFLGAAVLTALIFQEFDARGIFFFVGLLFISETFIQLRWRTGVVCPHCGFDPVLYVKEPEKAAAKVRAHLDKRADDPARFLGPAMHIPSRRPEKKTEKKAPGKGQRLSKQI
ncbi:MAG: hypothetical protein KF681_01715 [Bdellovibrionaceae bacterium]|nr:hypothetical protein [Pseudobdellovibrionaceae bacterium]